MAGHLTARKIETAKPGKYGDGANLYLVVSKTGEEMGAEIHVARSAQGNGTR
jgi:hypothetical protein